MFYPSATQFKNLKDAPQSLKSNPTMLFRITIFVTMLMLGACSRSAPPAGDAFEVAAELELTLWASEPMLVNPTNFDIDERGRIWLIESVNYRSDLWSRPKNDPQGDRIVILEDTNGDGQADSRKIFDQHAEMLAPLGISVLGNQVIVSQSPDIIVYTKNDDDQIVQKEVLLTGWRGVDHDHGLHVVLFGHDGRYYFNSGDQGFDTTDRSGNHLSSSREGPFYAATVQTMNPDGTDLRVLSHNARNPYEIALDSFGSIWQTDNDDDGNRWTRLLYVAEGSNFGYWGPSGRRWREDKGSHFHEERPGTMPYIARTGPGSPAGLTIYEGKLLPEKYHNALLHAEPGKRLIQAFMVHPDGAGYAMDSEMTVASTDANFRPSDVAVAPDGSVFVADWQDPGVGGHNMQDITQGRILRLAPKGHKTQVMDLDLASDAGLLTAFGSPNQATRFLAYQTLQGHNQDSKREMLLAAWRGPDEVLRARALWLLPGLGGAGEDALKDAIKSPDPKFRILGLRVARQYQLGLLAHLGHLAADSSPQVRREVALMMKDFTAEDKLDILLALASGYDGQDRWYLEALRLAATGAEDPFFQALRKKHPEWDSKIADIYWVLQASTSQTFLQKIIEDQSNPLEQRMEALDALAWQASSDIAITVAGLVGNSNENAELRNRGLYFLGKQLFSEWHSNRDNPRLMSAVGRGLQDSETRSEALKLVELVADEAFAPQLIRLARSDGLPEEDKVAAFRSLGLVGGKQAQKLMLEKAIEGSSTLRIAAIESLGNLHPEDLEKVLHDIVMSDSGNEIRSAALRVLGRHPQGLNLILDMEESHALPAELRTVATTLVNTSRDQVIRERAATVLPPPQNKNNRQVIRVREIVESIGNVERGRNVFQQQDGASCAKCHSLEAGEEIVGPNLATIASKYGKEGMLHAILHPSEGIAPEYASWILDTTSNGLLTGVLVEDTADRVIVRTEAADEIQLAPSDILERRQSNLSIMPEDLVNAMSKQELIDLLEFLATLQENQTGIS